MRSPTIRTVFVIGLTLASWQTSSRAATMEPQHSDHLVVAHGERATLIIDSPAPDATVSGPAIVTFRTENVRMTSLFAGDSLEPSLVRSGHLHVKIDSAAWHWVHSTADPVVISALPPGTHTVRLELADKNHRPLDVQTVTFTIAAPPLH